ncbi:PaaI family thioesterase [Chelativorans xinjiangense]|uniref:PaaI family thioesterase n=1 Tax=Chelativorans xinjiangense TaxID=2681485 RepID=UPI001FE7A2A1|nr:PaaI family thioesterase [Chelativorans xinjiangense]
MDASAPAGLAPVMSVEEVNAYLAEVYPQLNEDHTEYSAVAVSPGGCTVRLAAGEGHLRPGNTVSGPALFTLADIGGYVCALSHIGREALAVTTNLNINFMRKAEAGDIDGKCRILKLGKTLMVFEVAITAGPDRALVAHATGTYSLPPRHRKMG